MKDVLVGAVRVKDTFKEKETEKEIPYDNIYLYAMDYKGYVSKNSVTHGLVFQRLDGFVKPYKVRTVDFEAITGIKPEYFLPRFESEFMFRKMQVNQKENDYGKKEIIEIVFSVDDFREVYKNYQEAGLVRSASGPSVYADFDETEINEDEPEKDDIDSFEDDFDFDLDKKTGEVSVKKVKKGGKSEKD